MGMFDEILCEYPLPEPAHQTLDFQTKDLECLLDNYTITSDGRLIRRARRGLLGQPDRDIEWPLHGDIRFYTSVDKVWVEYVARFTHGRVEWIRPVEEARQAPGVPPDEDGWIAPPQPFEHVEPEPPQASPLVEPLEGAGGKDAPGAEEALLLNLRRDRPELEKLLQGCSNHWGYEDPVYRFYHQSFKVYSLQRTTRSIVDRLQVLAPDRPLNPWFSEIVRAGTGKRFKFEDNALAGGDPADSGGVLPRPVLSRDGRPLRRSRRPAQPSTQRVRGIPLSVRSAVEWHINVLLYTSEPGHNGPAQPNGP